MDDKTNLAPIDGFYFESVIARFERIIARLIGVIVFLIILLFLMGAGIIYVWNSYDYTDEGTEIMVDSSGEGNANYLNGQGDINNGTSDSQNMVKEKN